MLSTSAVESTFQIATDLDAKGVAVLAKPNSLLGRLVAATYIDYNPQLTEGGYYIDYAKMAQITDEASEVTGFSEHSARMEETAELLAKQMENYLVHARTVAAPYIDEYAQRLNAQADLIAAAPDAGVNVKIRRTNNLLLEPALMDAYQRSKELAYEALQYAYKLPEMTEAQLRVLLLTGSAVVDAGITEYFSGFADGWLLSVYNNVLRSGGVMQDVPAGGIDAYYSGREKVPEALALFLITRRLWNAPPDGTDMALAAYETAMVELRNQTALRLCHEYERMVRDGNKGILVSSTRKVTGQVEIEVNKEQYDFYLKQGGSVDALFGNQLQAHPSILTGDILANQKPYEAAWQRHYNINKSYFDQRRLLRMREALVVEWSAMAQSCSQEEFPLSERHVASVLIRRMAETASLEDFQDIALLAMRLTCRARFPRTADEAILLGMRRAKQNNPAITAHEAATISLMEYLYKWVGDNMEVVSANKVNVFSGQDHMHR